MVYKEELSIEVNELRDGIAQLRFENEVANERLAELGKQLRDLQSLPCLQKTT